MSEINNCELFTFRFFNIKNIYRTSCYVNCYINILIDNIIIFLFITISQKLFFSELKPNMSQLFNTFEVSHNTLFICLNKEKHSEMTIARKKVITESLFSFVDFKYVRFYITLYNVIEKKYIF